MQTTQLMNDVKTVVRAYVCAGCKESKVHSGISGDSGLGCGEACDMVSRILDKAQKHDNASQ